MLMKVHNKGQVVIPSVVRRALGIRIGDRVEVQFDIKGKALKIANPASARSKALFWSLAGRFAGPRTRKTPFPTPKKMQEALIQGLLEEHK